MEEERKVINLNIDDILPNRFQPRIKFSENAINELAESIKLHGVIQPIVVRKISDKYEIIAGERRYKASVMAGKTTIPAIVTTLDDRNSAEVALIENVQRQDLTPIEEAISYKKILDMGYINQEELGSKLGKKQSTIANKLRLLNLNDEVQEALMENKISERHARSLLKLDDAKQVMMLNRIINERLTVRRTDEEISKMLNNDDAGNDDAGQAKQIENEKGEEKMNNDILKDFNIPTEPIINDDSTIVYQNENNTSNQPQVMQSPVEELKVDMNPVEPIQPVENNITNEQPSMSQNVVNPGFMDIDKIQNEAQDIITEPAPVADMNELLKPEQNVQPTPVVEEMQPVQPVQENPVPQGGKFFNMFNFNEPEKDDSFVENVEDSEVNMDFGEPKYDNNIFTNPIPTEPIVEPMPVVEDTQPVQNVQPVQPLPVIDDVQPVEPLSFIEDVPSKEPVQEVQTEQPVDENKDLFTDTIQPFSLTDEDDFNQTVSQSQVQMPTNTYNEPINKSYMMDSDFKFDEDGEIEIKLPTEPTVSVDMKTVINTIRECAKKIESYGYKIDTDEIDLADSYEVTFKIEKM